MPWKTLTLIGERLRLVQSALKTRQPISQLCRSAGLSRKTLYKWLDRFIVGGQRALRDRSRQPRCSPRRTARVWLERIRRLRRQHRDWGAKKIRAKLRRQFPRTRPPATRTITKWIQRLCPGGRARRRSRKGPPVLRPPLTVPRRPNQVWTVDFKGFFRTRDGHRVDPLTVRDLFSRFVLAVRLLPDQSWWRVQTVFVWLFCRYGLPRVIRVDNGGPFGSTGPAGLSRLSAWWIALGIRVEFIRPGHPEQNGAHEQFHRVLKARTTRPASVHPRAQQRRTDRYVRFYNEERPHEALGQRTPAQLYRRGPRWKHRLMEWKYPRGWSVRRVRSNGQIKWQGRTRSIGEALVGWTVGLKPMRGGRHRVYFGKVFLGELHVRDAGGLRPAAYVHPRPSRRGKPKL
jgi:transposase InsO family protein